MSLERFESIAQSHVLRWPVVFDRAHGAELFDEKGNRYIDFCNGGYGHNNALVRDALADYLEREGLVHICDRTSAIQRRFVDKFVAGILQPRNLNYRILFTDPASGTAAEAALKLARRHKNRAEIVAFTSASHGRADGIRSTLRGNTICMPFCGFFGEELDSIRWFRRYLTDPASGLERPAAVIVETLQVHGGIRVASMRWLEELAALCVEFGMLLIIDDTITGCGTTGPYFSFEGARISPDMVVASNAIGGGLPLSILLLRPELDVWRPGEQVCVTQQNGLAFAAAIALLSACDAWPSRQVAGNSRVLSEELGKLAARHNRNDVRVRGKGMVWGLDFTRPGSAAVVSAWALERGVVVEPARMRSEVLLIRPAITIDETTLREGLDRLDETVSDFLNHQDRVGFTRQNSSITHQSVTKPK